MPTELQVRVAPTRDVRDAYFEELYRIAAADPAVIVLADDQGAFGLAPFLENLPSQFINVGIAEQNLVAVGAGLAMMGRRPVLYGIATFMSMRCLEQIRLDLCWMHLPVSIVACGPGFAYGSDGPTHHATQDYATLRTLPEISILSPADAVSTAAAARHAYAIDGPSYIRLEKGAFPVLYADDHNFSSGFGWLRAGSDVVLVATGCMVHTALQAAEQLALLGVNAGVLDIYRLKPIDAHALLATMSGTPRVVSLEENSIVGGLGTMLCEIFNDAGLPRPVLRLASADRHMAEYGPREWLHERLQLTPSAVCRRVMEWL